MKEIAFTVEPNSTLYTNYFAQKEERERFAKVASEFLNAHFPGCTRIMLTGRLAVKLNQQLEKEYKEQTLKNKTDYAFSTFKLKSAMNQLWVEQVISQIDLKKYQCNQFWWMEFPGNGHLRTSLWDDGHGKVYGYYCSELWPDDGVLPSYVTEIKMSAYYLALEETHREEKNDGC